MIIYNEKEIMDMLNSSAGNWKCTCRYVKAFFRKGVKNLFSRQSSRTFFKFVMCTN